MWLRVGSRAFARVVHYTGIDDADHILPAELRAELEVAQLRDRMSLASGTKF
jgi:hypothetical protein